MKAIGFAKLLGSSRLLMYPQEGVIFGNLVFQGCPESESRCIARRDPGSSCSEFGGSLGWAR